MAQFSYETYAQQNAARKAANTGAGGKLGPEVHFLGEYLKNDGDMVVVRFPYHTMNDITFETTHSVTFPNRKYPSRVRCEGAGKCPLCDEGVKVDTRFLVKAIAYIVDDVSGKVTLVNTVWDRPSAFADIDIKDLMDQAQEDFGTTLDNLLVKIKRSGSGQKTRYTLSLSVNNNRAVYNPEVYKADFTELNQVDAARILTKSYAQYQAALNPDSDTEKEEEVETTPVASTYTAPTASVTAAETTPVTDTKPAEEVAARPHRYTF